MAKRRRSRCSNCGKTGHNARSCTLDKFTGNLQKKFNLKTKTRRQCSYCKDLIHRGLLATIVIDARNNKSRQLKGQSCTTPLTESFKHTRNKCPLRAYAVDLAAEEIARGWERKVERMAKRGLGVGALYQITLGRHKGLAMITGVDWGVPEGGWSERHPALIEMCGTEVPSLTMTILQTGQECHKRLTDVYYTNIIARSPRPIEASSHILSPHLPWHRVVASRSFVG